MILDDVNVALSKISVLLSQETKLNSQISAMKSNIEFLVQAREFMVSFSEFSRKKIKDKLERIVNLALKSVFQDKEITFLIIPDKASKGIEYDLYVETDGKITPLMDAKGGGVLDVVTLSLRIAFIRIFKSKLRQLLILDEPFKNLDIVRTPLAVEWLSKISQEFEIQFIIVSHVPEIIENANCVYEVTNENGVSKVKNVKG